MKTINSSMGLVPEDVGALVLIAGLRFTISGVLVLAFFCNLEKKLLVPHKSELMPVATVGLVQTGAQYVFYYIGMAAASGVKSAVITGSTSFFAMIGSTLVFRQEKQTVRKLVSILIGLMGIAVANLNGLDFDFTIIGEGFVLIAAIMSAMGSCLVKRYSQRSSVTMLNAYQFIFGGLILTALGCILKGNLDFSTTAAVMCFLYLVIAAAVAQTLWSMLLKYNDVTKVTVFGLTIPIFGAALSALLLPGESINIFELLALLLVSIGISMANTDRTQKVTADSK